jgi:hypothetical protein
MGLRGSGKWVGLALAAAALSRVAPQADAGHAPKAAPNPAEHVDRAPRSPARRSPEVEESHAGALADAPTRWPAPVAIVVGDPLGNSSSIVTFDATGARRSIGVFAHAPGAALRAATISESGVAVVADVTADRDASFAGALFVAREGEPVRELARRVVHSSTPLAWGDRVLVSRGVAGAVPEVEPSSGAKAAPPSRVDDLTVDAIDPSTGEAETIAAFHGYLLFIAGRTRAGVALYRVGEGGADLVEVDARTHAERIILASLPPFARDFSVDEARDRIVFVDRDDGAWLTLRVDVENGEREVLDRSASMEVVPHVLSSGDVVLTRDSRRGAERLSGDDLELGAGVGRLVDERDGFAAGMLQPAGKLGRPFVVDLATGAPRFIEIDEGSRAIVAGFLRAGR